MVVCHVCGGEEFEKHAGFMYCAVCQTQSQEYHEQEYDFQDHAVNTIRQKKVPKAKAKSQFFYDDGLWTTWEAFNYIMYGMTQEMKTIGVNNQFEDLVFKLWAAYLRECQAAFVSRHEEKIPKLGFRFKERDARILYNVNVPSNPIPGTRRRRKSCSSKVSSSSNVSLSQSKRALALQKSKVITADYQDHLSLSLQSTSNLADETLESLGRSSELDTSEQSSDGESLVSCFKQMLTKKDYKLYKGSTQSRKLFRSAKTNAKKDIKCVGKNKLLSIIHLALLMTNSEIQLSDLLRFIRESHLSYAKVTHFFPGHIKFPKKDFSYIEVISDSLMPTHLRQRLIIGKLARLLKVESIPTPNMNKLVDRYCRELNLPKTIGKLSKKLLEDVVPQSCVPKSKTPFPSFEAWAMASIILVLKSLFGINDRTEVFLSCLAREVNRLENTNLFVFQDWQKFIECRKTILTYYHYPTQEQLSDSAFLGSKKFLDTLMKESKDEFRNNRFIPYSKYYIEENFLQGIKQTLNLLSSPQDVCSLEFKCSLTPLNSHVETILSAVSNEDNLLPEDVTQRADIVLPEKILKHSFIECDLEFVFNPRICLDLLDENSSVFSKFGITYDALDENNKCLDSLINCSSYYWVFRYPDLESGLLNNFKEEVLQKTPDTFQWLISECARMLEMNVRDLYDELLNLEQKLGTFSLS